MPEIILKLPIKQFLLSKRNFLKSNKRLSQALLDLKFLALGILDALGLKDFHKNFFNFLRDIKLICFDNQLRLCFHVRSNCFQSTQLENIDHRLLLASYATAQLFPLKSNDVSDTRLVVQTFDSRVLSIILPFSPASLSSIPKGYIRRMYPYAFPKFLCRSSPIFGI